MARTMTNAEVAATFRRLADLLAIRGEDAYRVGAYRRAAESIGQPRWPRQASTCTPGPRTHRRAT